MLSIVIKSGRAEVIIDPATCPELLRVVREVLAGLHEEAQAAALASQGAENGTGKRRGRPPKAASQPGGDQEAQGVDLAALAAAP
jgi:hypothetical protein